MKADLIEVSGGYCLSYNQPGAAGKSMCLSPDEARQARDALLKVLPLGSAAYTDNGFTVVEDPWKNADFVKGKYDEACLEVARIRQELDGADAAVSDNIRLQEKIERLQAALTAAIG